MQPTFNPWIGYFDLIDYVDTFVFLDTVQLNQQSWQTRNKLKISEKEYLFSLPIQKSSSKSELLIKDALLDFRKYDFKTKLIKTLEQNYKKSSFFTQVHPFLYELLFFETPYLSEYNCNIIQKIALKIGINTKIILLSQTPYQQMSKKGDLVLDVCKFFQTNSYVSPSSAKDYLEPLMQKFSDDGVDIAYQSYQHPTYNQLGSQFIPFIGIFDLLYNEGFEKSLEIIKSGRKYENR